MTRTCGDLGERQLIRRITEILEIGERDDCAIVEMGGGYLVWTTDMLHRAADFPEVATPWQMGWMSVAVNLSDIAAMGAEPLGLLIAAGIPTETDTSFVEALFAGFRDCARAYNTEILGGDLDSHQELTIVGSALGWGKKGQILRRVGARPGDLLCVTGSLGSAGAGLRIALGGADRDEDGDNDGENGENDLVKRLMEPLPRLREGRTLAGSRSVTAMMDNSDGLALSLSDLAEASGVGFAVREDRLPIEPAVRSLAEDEEDLLELALHSGGDFELVFTIRPDRLEEAKKACKFTIIGRAVEEGLWIESDGSSRPIEPRGYEHMYRGSG